MKPEIPGMMQAVSLAKEGDGLSVRQVSIPRPGPGEVLVKISAAPINPSDLAQIKRLTDPRERLSFIPGIEGCGRVVASGSGILPRLWLGKRVACSSAGTDSGTWAEYTVTPASHCVPLPEGISNEQGAMLLINPMTALAFLDMARQGGHKAIINTAAASALGRFIRLLGRKYNIPVIHIVRNDVQREDLLEQGSQYVLKGTGSNFVDELRAQAEKLCATLAFDAVGGSLTRLIMLAIPPGSTVVLYGNLSGEQPEVDYRSMVSRNIKVSGFFLGTWLKENSRLTTVRNILRARKILNSGMTVPVNSRFPLDKAGQAVETYLAGMTAGKVLLIPG